MSPFMNNKKCKNGHDQKRYFFHDPFSSPRRVLNKTTD